MKLTKQTFVSQYQKSLVQENSAIKDFQTFIQSKSSSILQPLKHYLIEGELISTRERQLEHSRVQKHLSQLQQQVSKLNFMLETSDPNTLRSLLLITQNNLLDARTGWNQANSALQERENALLQEIQVQQQRYQQIEKMQILPQEQQQTQKVKTVTVSKFSQPQPIQLIDEELKRINAPYGGWEPETHEIFWLQFLHSENENRRKFVERIANQLPTFTINALLRHDEFCMKMKALNDKKRLYIEKVKQRREEDRKEIQKNQLTKIEPETAKITQRDVEKIRAHRERKQLEKEDKFAKLIRQKIQQQKTEKIMRAQAKLALEKQKQKQAEQEAKKQQKALENKRLAEIDPETALNMRRKRLEIEEKHKKELEAQKLKFEKAKKLNEIDEIREQLLNEMAQKLAPVPVKRDPNALLKPTKAMELRKQQTEEAKRDGNTGKVQVGFDPFAVMPIGGVQRANWM
ncbi:Conserved_hypothetical protein [Hexamita inflata]|uniref:Uncharacterized protein n=1 Tax=Hexamita inflata TaxID=28002 RepID=A0AA86RLI9_9EUKA|nr:Conserved hypothetical protein [Hexamita inflata]